MQIEHNRNEHSKLPNYGEKKIAEDKFGPNPKPSDLLFYLLPFALISIGLFILHGY